MEQFKSKKIKKLLLLLVVVFMSCDQPVKEKPAELDFPYEPTYQKEWKIGSQENILLVQNLHKAIIDVEVEKAYSYMSEDVVVWHGDGSTTEGLDEFKEMYDEALRSGAFTDYSIGVNISVVSEEGHEWVLLWDTASAGGQATNYMEAFRIEDGKIIAMNQFSKPVMDSDDDDDESDND